MKLGLSVEMRRRGGARRALRRSHRVALHASRHGAHRFHDQMAHVIGKRIQHAQHHRQAGRKLEVRPPRTERCRVACQRLGGHPLPGERIAQPLEPLRQLGRRAGP